MDQLVDVDRPQVEFQLAVGNAGDVEQVVDESGFQFHVAADQAKSFFQLRSAGAFDAGRADGGEDGG